MLLVMKITAAIAQEMLDVLDHIREEIEDEEKLKYPFTEWERKRETVKARLSRLPELIEEASSQVTILESPGRPRKMKLSERVTLFLLARWMDKSNRGVEEFVTMFSLLFKEKISYKTVERLYSDGEVRVALHNLFYLLLKEEGVSGNYTGDGTGYSVTVTKHYRSDPKKQGKDYRYAFRLLDLTSGMYVGMGYSRKSEKEAFNQAMHMVQGFGFPVDSMRLDKYYSTRTVLQLLGSSTAVFVIPRKNIANVGVSWSRVIRRMIEDPYRFMKQYFLRNVSESGFSSDKRRFGRYLRQKREDRKENATFAIGVWHNIYAIRIPTH